MGRIEAHENLDELQLLGQAEVQRLEEEEVEAYEVEAYDMQEEDSKKLFGMSESPELPRKMMDRKKMSRHHHKHIRVSRCYWLSTHLNFFKKITLTFINNDII